MNVFGGNLFTYCDNNPITNNDPSGYFTIRRWMVSVPLDIVLMMIPGIGAAFAPVKSLAKSYGKAALKTKVVNPLAKVIKLIAKNASKVIKGFQNVLCKIPGVGAKLASKIPVSKLVSMLAGATASVIVNKLINIDIVLSLGGLVSGILDFIFDKKLNNSIWVI